MSFSSAICSGCWLGLLWLPCIDALVRLFSFFKIDAVDYPNARRINTKPMPSAGGLSIVIAFSIATLVFISMPIFTTAPIKSYHPIPAGRRSGITIASGLIDDVKRVSSSKRWYNLLAAVWSVLQIFGWMIFKIPFGGPFTTSFEPWVFLSLTAFDCYTYSMRSIWLMDYGLVSGVSIISLYKWGV